MTLDRTIAFVDLAGFTALTGAHGDDAALEVVDSFTDAARDAVNNAGVELVKTIGDAVMLAAIEPSAALNAVRPIFEACLAIDSFPELRAGIHHGPVLSRDGDYFGATVNLAARVTGRASSGQTLGTVTIFEAAKAAGIDTIDLGWHELRNVADRVKLWAIELSPTQVELSVDPVCRMRLGRQTAVGHIRHNGVEHWLCSLKCIQAFTSDPDRYLTSQNRR